MKDRLEAIEVMARFDTFGKATPIRFTWRGTEYQIDSTGRRWEDQDGQHILVMIPGGQTFELVFRPAETLWYLSPIGAPSTLA